MDNYLKSIKEWALDDYILLTCTSLSFARLIAQSDIVLRPTCTDGDALTIREALDLNKPVVASDVVGRPAGTILFKNRDLSDLCDRVVSLIRRMNQMRNSTIQDNNYMIIYKNIYSC